jgi:anti-anti-sigma regulatory factor
MFSVEEHPDAVVLNVIGALDQSVAGALECALESWRNLESKRLLISFERCTYVDFAAASVIGRFRTVFGARFGIAAGANIPPSLLDVLGDDVPTNLERLLFCDSCTHGITFHGMFGCRFSRCRCTMSSSRLIAGALDATKPEDRDQLERTGPRILHRYSTKSYPTKPSDTDC